MNEIDDLLSRSPFWQNRKKKILDPWDSEEDSKPVLSHSLLPKYEPYRPEPLIPPVVKIDTTPKWSIPSYLNEPKKLVDRDALSMNQHWMLPNELPKPGPMSTHCFEPTDFGPKRPIIEPMNRSTTPLLDRMPLASSPLSHPAPITIRPVQSAC